MTGAIRAELRLRGPARLQVGEASHLLERKTAAMLCVLAVDGEAARATLAAWLWPDASVAAARRNLRQRIFQLNRRFGREIVAGGPQLRLADGIDCDLDARAATPSAGGVLAGLCYDELGDFAAWLAPLRERLGRAVRAPPPVRGDVREALAAMLDRLESLLLAAAAPGAPQVTSTRWVPKRPARRSAK